MTDSPLFEPYEGSGKKPTFTILRFAPELATVARPAKRARARLYCPTCQRHHHLAWGELRNAITKHGATDLESIVQAYAWKYCDELEYGDHIVPAITEAEVALKQQLESLHPDVFVVECVHLKDHRFAMKLQTPRKIYCDVATATLWRDLVLSDIEKASRPLRCPYCNSDDVQDNSKRLDCRDCGAMGYDAILYAQHLKIKQDHLESLSAGAAASLLKNFRSIFVEEETPDGRTMLWVSPSRIDEIALPRTKAYDDMAASARGAWTLDHPVKAEIPMLLALKPELIFDEEDLPELDLTSIMACTTAAEFEQYCAKTELSADTYFPLCGLCSHALPVHTGEWHDPERWHCTYPHTPEFIEEAIGSPVGVGSYHYKGEDTAILNLQAKVWDVLLERALEPFPNVHEHVPALEGLDPEFKEYLGPLCPSFELNREHDEIGEDCQPLAFTKPLIFGVPNFAAIHAEKEKARLDAALEKCVERLQAIDTNNEALPILRQRVTMENIHNPEGKKLLSFIEKNIPGKLLVHSNSPGYGYENPLRLCFNVSRKAWDWICDQARARQQAPHTENGTKEPTQ